MTADYSTNICIDGTTEELLAMLAVVRKYLPDPPKYRPDIRFDWVEIWRKSDKSTFYLEKLYGMKEEEQRQFLDTFEGELSISAAGPFGYFDLISSIPLFHNMAHAAPNASFDGSISGYTSYDESELEAELKDGKLRIIDRFRDNEGYSYEIADLLPWEVFAALFKVNGDDKDEIDCLIEELTMEDDFPNTSYKKFKAVCKSSAITEEEYADALKKVRELGVISYDEYGSTWPYEEESVYDVSANGDTNAEDVTNTPESDGPPTQCPHCKGEHLVLQQGKMRKHFQQILQTDSKGKEIYVCEDCETILVR